MMACGMLRIRRRISFVLCCVFVRVPPSVDDVAVLGRRTRFGPGRHVGLCLEVEGSHPQGRRLVEKIPDYEGEQRLEIV